ncbi:MAG: DUF3383 domain-containing protein [Oscillospiraceae bacterium]|jgi:hypothetical protein|nr:DUF3383 domain-containing protein [Oscillospiraceae bacterium]
MPRDVIVVVRTDAKPRPTEALDILIAHATAATSLKTYRELDEIEADYPVGSAVYAKAAALFDQGKTTLADTLIRKVSIVGFAPPDSGATADEAAQAFLTAIQTLQQTQDDWYILLTTANDDSTIKALAQWAEDSEPTEAELGAGAEDHRKLYFFQTSNKTLAVANRRAIGIYTANLDEHADAAFLGVVGPFYPTSVTWKFKRPQGVSYATLTNGERDLMDANHLNYVTREYKREYVKEGVCCDGEYIDVQLGADWIAIAMRERLYDTLLNNPKVPYTDTGFVIIAAAVYSVLDEAVTLGIIARDFELGRGIYNVYIPRRADATDDQARERRMPDIIWEAQLDGAVHRVKVKGTLSATLATL